MTDSPLSLITKVCKTCNLVKPIEEFAKSYSKRKYGDKVPCWANTCKVCKSARDSLRIKVKPVRVNAPIPIQILRARLFLRLWHSGYSEDACLAKVDEIYPTWKREWIQ